MHLEIMLDDCGTTADELRKPTTVSLNSLENVACFLGMNDGASSQRVTSRTLRNKLSGFEMVRQVMGLSLRGLQDGCSQWTTVLVA